MQRSTDHELIKQALSGDQNAFTDLLSRYKNSIYSFIFQMVHNKQEAEDLTQETFIKAFAALSTFNEKYAFSTWIYKIATNNCIDFLRKKRLKTYSIDKPIRMKDGEVEHELPDITTSPDKQVIRDERKSIIENAIDSLQEKYKEVILLRHKEERSYEEIAEMLDIPLGTVKVRIFRAREMLNKYLKNKRNLL